jgi:hypothetical protein
MTDPKDPFKIPPQPAEPAEEERREEERREDDRPDEIGIIPGKVPGRPVDPADPRFPGSQPDLA